MKVAIFTDTYLPDVNGVSNTLGRLSAYFDHMGIEYLIFAPGDEHIKKEKGIKRFPGIRFFLYPQVKLCFPFYSRVKKALTAFKPDIIHIVTEFGIGRAGLKYALNNKIPLVSSFHTNIPEYLKYFHFDFLENFSWRYLLKVHLKANRVFVPSNSTKKSLQNKGLKNISIWSRGIDKSQYSPDYRDESFRKEYGLVDKTVFLYVGRVSPEKDIDILMETFNRLNLKYKDKIHLIIVGDGPLLSSLKEKAPSNITFLGFLRGNTLSKVYASSDIFIFPSSTETFGNVVIEAMASGVPVISCLAGGIADNLINGVNGLGIKPRDLEGFYNASERLLLNTSLRAKLASNGYDFISILDWNIIFSKLVTEYHEVIFGDDKYNIQELKKAIV